MTSHSGDRDVAGLCFWGAAGVVVAVVAGAFVWMVLFVLVPPPTIESIEKPIFGLDGTATIGVGARGIIVCVCALFQICPSSFVCVTKRINSHFADRFPHNVWAHSVL
jgi:hypothetical protein